MEAITIKIDEAGLKEVVRAAVREEMAQTSSTILNKRQASKFLGMSTVSLWKLERKGILKPIKIGVREVYTRKSLEDFLQGATAAA